MNDWCIGANDWSQISTLHHEIYSLQERAKELRREADNMARQVHEAMAAAGSQSQGLSLPQLSLTSQRSPPMLEAPVLIPSPSIPPNSRLLPLHVRNKTTKTCPKTPIVCTIRVVKFGNFVSQSTESISGLEGSRPWPPQPRVISAKLSFCLDGKLRDAPTSLQRRRLKQSSNGSFIFIKLTVLLLDHR